MITPTPEKGIDRPCKIWYITPVHWTYNSILEFETGETFLWWTPSVKKQKQTQNDQDPVPDQLPPQTTFLFLLINTPKS